MPGQSVAVELSVTPSATYSLGQPLIGQMVVFCAGDAVAIPFNFVTKSSTLTQFQVRVEDEHTYWSSSGASLNGTGPGLGNALVQLADPFQPNLSFQVAADANGLATFSEIPEGLYSISASAVGHVGMSGAVNVVEGQQAPLAVFLPTKTVTYEFSVIPTTVQDEYSISIVSTFATAVPTPKVKIEPAVVNLEIEPGAQQLIEFAFTNQGLISAKNPYFEFSQMPGYKITPLMSDIPDIAGGQIVYYPILVERLPTPSGGPKSGTPPVVTECNPQNYQIVGLGYSYNCGGSDVWNWSPACIYANTLAFACVWQYVGPAMTQAFELATVVVSVAGVAHASKSELMEHILSFGGSMVADYFCDACTTPFDVTTLPGFLGECAPGQ